MFLLTDLVFLMSGPIIAFVMAVVVFFGALILPPKTMYILHLKCKNCARTEFYFVLASLLLCITFALVVWQVLPI